MNGQPASGVAPREGALDGLRGLAALMVIMCHVTAHLPVWPYATGGNIGVLVFFVLSGYLIGGQLWRHPATWSTYRRFVRRRVTRLLPAVAGLALVGSLLLTTWGGQPWREAARSAAFALTQTTGFAWAFGVPVSPPWSPTWSLTVEWTFYLLLPIGVIAARRAGWSTRRGQRTAYGLAALLYAVGLALPPVAFYLLPVANLGVMFAGVGLALTHHQDSAPQLDPAWGTFGLVALGTLALLPGTTLGPAYRFMILPTAAAATLLVINGCRHPTITAKALSSAGLPAVGLRAYSLYLWHMPVLWLLWFNLRSEPPWVVVVLFCLIVPLVTMVSFRLLERPWLSTHVPTATPRPPTALEATS